ncbi:MAG TPA: ABC transporter [Acidimicrobiaceae bacterium]|nr:ABC transporter [Acidimicrobiaceae bacterium]
MTAAIVLDDVTVRFESTVAVSGVQSTVVAGEWVGLVGANGAGKTTLLRAIAHLERHDGTVRVADRDLGALSYRRRARLVAYVPQKPELPSDMSVMEYTLLGRTPHLGYFASETGRDRRYCRQLLERLGMAALGDRRISTLSGGETQRVVLARALAQEAPIVLLDEPTSALDLGRRVEVLELVDELRRERELTVVSALHDLTLAAEFADRLMLLAGGALVACGSPTDVLHESVLAEHLGAPVRVLQAPDGGLVVVPPARLRRRHAETGVTDGARRHHA